MSTDDETPAQVEAPERVRGPKHRRTVIATITVAAVLLGAGGITAWSLASPAPQAEAQTRVPKTVEAVEQPLSWAIRTTGEIVFTGTREFTATRGGVLTELPAPGTTVAAGDALYRVDDRPVIYLNGKIPAWRSFETGMDDGPDVRQLEQSLADLGFFDGTIDDSFTGLTRAGIRRWQEANGMKKDGMIPLGGVVFGTGSIRVGAPKATIGATVGPGTAIYQASGSDPVVTAKIPVADRANVPVGTEATFSLPDGQQLAGRVTVAGDPVEDQDANGKTQVVVPITITPEEPKELVGRISLSVQVRFEHKVDGDVLQVPVAALLAVADDKYTVEVYRNKRIVAVPVETGRFADGMVEITGGGLEPGDAVVVPG